LGWGAARAGRSLGGLGRGDRLTLGAGQDEDLPDDEIGVRDPVRLEDLRLGDAVLLGDGRERVSGLDREHEPGDRWDLEDLATMQGVLVRELVGPPDGHHGDVVRPGDLDQGVPGLDRVRANEVAAVGHARVHGDRLEQGPIGEERSLDEVEARVTRKDVCRDLDGVGRDLGVRRADLAAREGRQVRRGRPEGLGRVPSGGGVLVGGADVADRGVVLDGATDRDPGGRAVTIGATGRAGGGGAGDDAQHRRAEDDTRDCDGDGALVTEAGEQGDHRERRAREPRPGKAEATPARGHAAARLQWCRLGRFLALSSAQTYKDALDADRCVQQYGLLA
jgi:hypothetical protein